MNNIQSELFYCLVSCSSIVRLAGSNILIYSSKTGSTVPTIWRLHQQLSAPQSKVLTRYCLPDIWSKKESWKNLPLLIGLEKITFCLFFWPTTFKLYS